MPELTVSMPAYNSGKYIKAAVESVLQQQGVDFELIIVDDGSQDNTVDLVQSLCDDRITLIKNPSNRGIAFCHNLVIHHSTSPFIIHVDSDDLVLPGAFQKMMHAMTTSPRVGQVHCHFFDVNEIGSLTQEAFRQRRRTFLKNRPPDMDYKRELLVRGSVMNSLRTYRRQVFDTVGLFNEQLKYGEDYEMALRIVDRFDIKLVPEFLYCRRMHSESATARLGVQNLRFWWQRYQICRRLLKSDQVRFPKQEPYHLTRLMWIGFYNDIKYIGFPVKRALLTLLSLRRHRETIKNALKGVKRRLAPLTIRLYNLIVDHFSWWPIEVFPATFRESPLDPKRIAYYIWRYPSFPLTFMDRELKALKDAGLTVDVIADASGDVALLDDQTKSLTATTHYVNPMDRQHLSQYKRYFFRRSPLIYMNLFLYVVFHRYAPDKHLTWDIKVFHAAVYLAGILDQHHLNHIHAPWADRCAFSALIASKLLGVTYSVQARASADVFRHATRCALPEKLDNALFILTNSKYSAAYVESVVSASSRQKIHPIYKGIDLDQFQPRRAVQTPASVIRILSVARLVEPKGLVYLLQACQILREQGCPFTCEIIGGPETPQYMNYYLELKKLHQRLALEDYVSFPGALPFSTILERYQDADIFALPCVIAKDGARDIIPNSLIEAMAMQLPVVSTRIAAMPEIIQDGVSGLLVEPEDAEALAHALITLIEDAGLRKKLGENARRFIEERFDINQNIQQCVQLFTRETGR